MKIKDLSVTVTYSYGCEDIDIPSNIAKQLNEASKKGNSSVNERNYPEAFEWLCNEVKEKDCMDWDVEIDNLEIDEQ